MLTKTKYPWVYIADACEDLANKIKSEVDITYVIGIARGGLIPATLIAKHLGVREVLSFGLRSYKDGDDFQESHAGEIIVYQDVHDCYQLLGDKNILIVDDITDKGNTFKYVQDTIRGMSTTLDGHVYTASIFSKPGTLFTPSYVYTSAPEEEWVVFPWEN